MNQIIAKPDLADKSGPSLTKIGTVVVEAPKKSLANLALQGMLLTAVTFGLYRFWYVTKVRRFFWAHTRIGNQPLEFTGHPAELIVGFLMAVAILLPLYLGLFVVSLGVQNGVFAANVGALFILWFLSQFGLYRARNYRLTRTLWRGLRFRQSGSGIVYALLSMMWFSIGMASFGLLWPLRRRALQGYKMRHTYFGAQRASFSASITPLYRAGWPLFTGISCIAAWTVWQLAVLWQAMHGTIGFPDVLMTDIRNVPIGKIIKAIPLADFIWMLTTSIVAFVFLLAIAGPSYLSAETRHFANAISFGSIRINSVLSRQALVAVWTRFLIVLMVFSLVYLGLGAVLFGAFLFSDLPVGLLDSSMTRFWFFAALFIFYCAGFVAYAVIHLVYLRFRIWQIIGNSLSISPMEEVSNIEAGRSTALHRRDGFGEGIADALDAGGL